MPNPSGSRHPQGSTRVDVASSNQQSSRTCKGRELGVAKEVTEFVELDEATEFVDEGKIQLQVAASASADPRVVAWLMRLESLPKKNWALIGKSPGLVT
ncbi:hypothetical protein SLE2022_022070 [Rubroshorea leprosula]